MALEVALRARVGTFTLDVAFVAPPGITVLFGPSGAGKSQTLRGIAGLMRPDAGRIVLDGRVLFDRDARIAVPARARRVGYLFQQYALFPHLDVAGNIAYGLPHLPRDRRAARVAEVLALVGLPGYERRRMRELSGGQQQRVALARALAPEPDLLLLDEPFSAVDALLRRQLRAELLEVHRRTGVPMVLVTPDLGEVRQLADYLALVEGGRVLQEGSPTTVLARPVGERAAALLETAGAF